MQDISLMQRPAVAGYPTFSEAIRRNNKSPRSILARETSAQVAGKALTDAFWSEDHVAFATSDGVALHFSVAEHEVEWEIIDARQLGTLRPQLTCDPEPVRLHRHRAADGHELVNIMDRVAIARILIGGRIRRIVNDEFGVYLHLLENRRYLALHAQTAEAPTRPFLEWFDDED